MSWRFWEMEEGLKGFSGKERVFRSKWQGLSSCKSHCEVLEVLDLAFLHFPYRCSHPTQRGTGKHPSGSVHSRIEGNPWAPKNPPVDVKLVRWIKRQNVVFAQRSFWWKSVVSHCSSQPRSCHNLLGGGWQHWFGPARKAGLTAGETCIMAHDGHCMPLLWLFCTLKTSPFFWRPSPQHTRKTDLTRWMARVFATHRNSVSGQQLIRHLDAIERLMLEASTSIRFRSGFLEKSWN